MKKLKIGIMSVDEFRLYTINIAKGKIKPKPDAPKLWFDSVESMAHILSIENRNLLHIIKEKPPQSIDELAKVTGRKKRSLSQSYLINNGSSWFDKASTFSNNTATALLAARRRIHPEWGKKHHGPGTNRRSF